MVGLEKFKEAFESFSDNYVIIGGTACEITMTGTTVRPRATHDIDMIVVVEKMNAEFGRCFWNFIKEAGYRPERHKANADESAKYELYRFIDGKDGYPAMIELLSRHPDALGNPRGLLIEPLPAGENVSSLSAIIMDDDYYNFTVEHSRLTGGIRHADPIALIALKTRAYLNLLQEKAEGKQVNTKDIRKHRTDVIKNTILISPDERVVAPQSIVDCIHEFTSSIRSEWVSLAPSLAAATEQSEELVSILLNQLDNSFK